MKDFSGHCKTLAAKINFKKMHRRDLKCIFLCDQEETQTHIFEHCQAIKLKLNILTTMKLSYIYGTLSEQLEAISVFEKIDDIRNLKKQFNMYIVIA